MGEEITGRDLQDSVFWGVDLSRSFMRDINFTGVSMHSVWLTDVTIDGLVERLVINGVDVTEYVHDHDPWQPLRSAQRAANAADMLAAFDDLAAAWSRTIGDARAMPDERRHQSVNGEWSFVQTLRHLVMAIDKWFTHPVLGQLFDPIGLPNSGSTTPFPGIDLTSTPTFEAAVASHAEAGARLHAFLVDASQDDLERTVDVIENGPHSIGDCVRVVFEEAFEHLRYARRDVAILMSGS
jgi:hypothetical protein